jgi:hypothetical protein
MSGTSTQGLKQLLTVLTGLTIGASCICVVAADPMARAVSVGAALEIDTHKQLMMLGQEFTANQAVDNPVHEVRSAGNY